MFSRIRFQHIVRIDGIVTGAVEKYANSQRDLLL